FAQHLTMLLHRRGFLCPSVLLRRPRTPTPFPYTTLFRSNEYFGKPGLKRISYLTAMLIAYAFLVIFMAIALPPADWWAQLRDDRSEEHTSELQSRDKLVCRLLLEKKNQPIAEPEG